MRKIFISIPWFLPAFRAGGPVQSIANLTRHFTGDLHYFIYTSDTDLNGAALENITIGEWVPFNEHTHVWYANPGTVSDDLVKQVERIKPDVLFIVGMYSWHFNIVPVMYCKAPRKIISARGMLHPAALRQRAWKKKLFLKAFRLLEYQHKVHFHATDEQESRYIEKTMGNGVNIFIANNFPNLYVPEELPHKSPGHICLVSVGIVNAMKNYLFVLQALSKLTFHVEYEIYGPIGDEEYWHECKDKIKLLPANISVKFKREIAPERVGQVLRDGHVFILPSKSENFGHAIYEALSAGRPVITSKYTPWNGLKAAKAGFNVDIDMVDEACKAISYFADLDHAGMEEWGRGAVAYARNALDVEKITNDYEVMFDMDK